MLRYLTVCQNAINMKQLKDKQDENIRYQTELLAMILNNDKVYINAIDVIRADMFTDSRRLIFDTYVKMINESRHPDAVSISTFSNVPLEEVLKIATYYSGTALKTDALLYELFDHMAKSKLVKMSANVSQQVQAGTKYEDIITIVNDTLRKLELGNSSSVINMEMGVQSLLEIINNNRKETSEITGIPTGFSMLDKHMGGLQPTDLIILAGEISHGKTALALSIMFNAAVKYKKRCGIISHEMSPEQLMSRFAAYTTHISAKTMLIEKLSDHQMKVFADNIDKLIRANIFIQDYIKRELSDTLAAVRLMVMQQHVNFVVIENAGNINVKGKYGDEERTAEISKSCKALALELKIPIILISHLARERDGKKVQPDIHRLKHSGQLEQDADVVLFIYRAELHGLSQFDCDKSIPTKGRAKLYFGKGRNYGTAVSYPEFLEELVYFKDFEQSAVEEWNFKHNKLFDEPDIQRDNDTVF